MTGIDILMKVARKEDLTDSERNTLYEWASGHDVSKTCVDGLFSGRTEITELSQIAENFGSATSGEVVFGESGNPNNDPSDFSGVAMSYPGYTRGSKVYYIIGEDGGVLKFGLASDGSATFLGGTATLDENGLTMNGAGFPVAFLADDGGTEYRRAYLGMETMDGGSIPAFKIDYRKVSANTELVTNGTFDSALTGWTAASESNGAWTWLDTLGGRTGLAAFLVSATGTVAGNITQNFSVDPSTQYDFSVVCGNNTLGRSGSVKLLWYTSTPSLIQTDTIFDTTISSTFRTFANTKTSPPDAASVTVKVSVSGGAVLGEYSFAVDDITMKKSSMANSIWFHHDTGQVMVGGGNQAAYAYARQDDPGTGVYVDAALDTGGSLVEGTAYRYKASLYDAGGETLMCTNPSTARTATATHKTVNVDIYIRNLGYGKTPLPFGVTGAKIYRNENGGEYYYLASVTDVSTAYVDDGSVAISTTTQPTLNTTSTRPFILPAALIMSDLETQVTGTGRGYNLDASQVYGFYRGASLANSGDGDSCVLPLFLPAGTFTMTTVGLTSSSRGKIDYYIDGVSVATGQDWYSAGVVYNVGKTASVTISTPGYHALQWVVNGKNAAATDYAFGYTFIKFTPSAY